MRKNLVEKLRCPNCNGDVDIESVTNAVSGRVMEGSLACNSCGCLYRISEGIPILLPQRFSNEGECELRRAVSETASREAQSWESLYDVHHFRRLSHLRIEKELQRVHTSSNPKILDVGVGWGVNYVPYIDRIDLFGLDFSFESLLFLKKIYEACGAQVPDLICASLSAIPFKDINFNLVWSTQVYQHIPDAQEIRASIDYVVRNLLADDGTFVMDNLNYNYFRSVLMLKRVLKLNLGKEAVAQEQEGGDLYLKYYTEEDLYSLTDSVRDKIVYRIIYTETLFHPEIGFAPGSRIIALADKLVQKTPLAKYIARQIGLVMEKKR